MNLLTRRRPIKSLVPSIWNEEDWLDNFSSLSGFDPIQIKK